jgi:peptidoglycan/xylan/chitin deacetylase (PgdA/CDA1 family)
VIGEKLRDPKARALVQQARDAGHVIGNHTRTHGAPIRRPAACRYAVASPGRISRAIFRVTRAVPVHVRSRDAL